MVVMMMWSQLLLLLFTMFFKIIRLELVALIVMVRTFSVIVKRGAVTMIPIGFVCVVVASGDGSASRSGPGGS